MTNTDPTAVHSFTSGTVDGFAPSPDGVFDTGVLMYGDAFEWIPTEAGEQPYYCMLHAWMIGTIIVQEAAAEVIASSSIKKPITAFIAGLSAPKGKRIGHAGAIISGNKGTAQSKIDALSHAGVHIASSPAKLGETMLKAMQKIDQ